MLDKVSRDRYQRTAAVRLHVPKTKVVSSPRWAESDDIDDGRNADKT